MRWDNLLAEAQDARTLPGYRDPAVIRRFDAPEALDTRFYEVHCKSAINQVPKQSRMPFRFTINPYRGCSHACVYCLAAETPVLLADGRVKPIGELAVGDAIYGTRREGAHRRYVETEVLARWETRKEASRVTLEDGTELVASGDHRFLTARDWKYVTDLTLGDRFLGTGAFAAAPVESYEYRRGYLCGLIRGDGHVGHGEAPQRASEYLDGMDVAVPELTQWPERVGDDWYRGFLAGIFDAKGRCGAAALRITHADPEVLGCAAWSLGRLGLGFTVGPREVRLLGGLREQLRFLHTVDPTISRKLPIEGQAIEPSGRLGVAEVEPLGRRVDMCDITTGTGDFIANGVVSHNCFARPTHKFLDFDAGRDFEREIVVKVNLPEVLRAELARPSWGREHVALGTNTDPYQWVEGRYKLMPEVWRALLDSGTPCSLLTKSPLLLRDVDLLKQLSERVGFTANVSVPTLDEKAWRETEPHTPHPRKRLEAIAELGRAGIPTGVLIAPLMPGINDSPEQVERILELATEAGAQSISGITLHLRGEVRDVFMGWLRAQRPDLVERYERLYARGAYAPAGERRRHGDMVRAAGRRGPPPRSDPAPDGTGHGRLRERISPEQESLF